MPRTVLVTGGGTGIGLAIASRFAADGDDVIITGRRGTTLKQAAAEINATALVCDATRPADWQAADLPPEIDVLVNNAGGNTNFDTEPPTDLAGIERAWQANLAANLISAVLATNAVRDRLTDGGAVVHLGSIAADKGAGAYGAAKAALASWNVDLARELGPRRVTSNVVSPGFVADTEFFRGRLTEQRRTTLVNQTATKRAGAPDDIAGVVHFLTTPAACHITAQVINVNGGAWSTR